VTRRLTAAEVGDVNIEMASRPRTGSPALQVSAEFLYVPRVRDVPLPEPVATGILNGRPPGGWRTCFGFCWFPPADGGFETDAIVAARERERAAEAVLLGGLT